jgi:methionine synthase II (cobalamin-independent)
MLRFDSIPTTIIGSLPWRTPVEALDRLERHPLTIPAWPQLPKRSFREGMVFQYSEGFPGIGIDPAERKIWIAQTPDLPDMLARFYEQVLSGDVEPFAMSEEYAAGLLAFLERGRARRDVAAVKGQVTGPFTLGLSLSDQEGKGAWFDDQYRDVLVKALTKKALWQISRLSALADEVIIFFDEPIFAALGTPAYIGISEEDVVGTYTEVFDELHHAGATVGIHCCGNMDWGLLTRTPVDIISFDAYSFGDKVALYGAEMDAFLRRGGWLAWGLVPTGNPEAVARETVESLREKQEKIIGEFARKGVDRSLLTRRMLMTPSCGMGTLPPQSAERVLSLLCQLRDSWQASLRE